MAHRIPVDRGVPRRDTVDITNKGSDLAHLGPFVLEERRGSYAQGLGYRLKGFRKKLVLAQEMIVGGFADARFPKKKAERPVARNDQLE